jgi:Zn-dependent protease with chaperone function
MTSFFENQDRARRNTRVLVLLMAAGVIAMGCAIYALLVLVEQRTVTVDFSTGALKRPGLLQLDLLLWCVLGTAAIVAVASTSRSLSLRGGGAQIAEMMGGRLVSGSPRDALDRRLLNVVEEMAIASGVPVPMVFVLDQEEGINAFAAGFALDDAAIAVTRGCLEKLTRDELQGVIGHELSHVLNGDMKLNIRLMGIVFGIVCLGLLGRLLVRAGSTSSYVSSSSRRERGGSPGAALLFIGLGVMAIGAVGELCGKLIKAAVSRQREFLADASAVQFTRNPDGIAGALKKIGGWRAGAGMQAAHAEEASHFFFGDIHKRLFDGSVFATHPPLGERIKRIDPGFDGQLPEVGEGIAQPEDDGTTRGFAAAAAGPGAGRAAAAGAAAGVATGAAAAPARDAAGEVVGRVGSTTLDDGRRLLGALPAALREGARTPFSACSMVFALLLSEDPQVRSAQAEQIARLAGPSLQTETERLCGAVQGLGRQDRLPLVALLAPALRALSFDQRAAFSRTVQALIDADAQVSIFEYVVAQTLRERLSPERSAPQRARVRYRSLSGVQPELQLLLSLLAHAGAFEAGDAERAFAAGAQRLAGLEQGMELLPQSERLLFGLAEALTELRALSPQLCAQVVDACAHAVIADRRVTDDEDTLLRAVCEALGCPLPPLPAG